MSAGSNLTPLKASGLRPPSKISRPAGPLASGSHLSVSKESVSSGLGAAATTSSVTTTRPAPSASISSTTTGHAAPSPTPSGSSLPLDSLIIGDKVLVGQRFGRVAFVGEVKFAKGDWVGVVLDEAAGKNDGSVAGVRYFQCEQNHGLFVTLQKVQKLPSSPAPPVATLTTKMAPPTQLAPRTVPETPLQTPAVKPDDSLPPTQPVVVAAAAEPAPSEQPSLLFGDRVVVGGNRVGTIRFIGSTNFAPGDWVGIELDGPLGKNDGSVQGKRYFECRPLFGLFAPLQKVQKVDANNPVPNVMAGSVVAPPPTSALAKGTIPRPGGGIPVPSGLHRAESNESITSVGSSASKSARPPVGITPMTSSTGQAKQVVERRMSGQLETLQKALREKEEHVDQLLKEIELSRNEIARISTRADNLEGALSRTNTDHEQYVFETNERLVHLNACVAKLEAEKQASTSALDDEKRKVEDLLFQLEEQSLTTDEMMQTPKTSKFSADAETLAHLSRQMESLQSELTRSSEKMKDAEVQLSKLQASCENERGQNAALSKEIASLRSQMDEKQVQLAHFQQLSSKQEADSSSLRNAETQLRSQLNEMTTSKTALMKEVEQLRLANGDTSKEKAELQSQILELSSKNSGLQKTLVELEANVTKRNAEVDAAKTSISNFEGSLGKLKLENESLKSQISDLEATVRRSSQSESTAVKDLQDSLNKTSEEVRTVKTKLHETEEAARQREVQLQTTNSALNQKVAELESHLQESSKAEVESGKKLTQVQESLGKEIDELKASFHRASAEVEAGRQRETELHATNSALNKKISDLELTSRQNSQSEAAALKSLRESSLKQAEEMKLKAQQLEEVANQRETELHRANSDLTQKVSDQEAEMHRKIASIAELTKKLSDREAELAGKAQVESEMAVLKQQLSQLQSSYEDMTRKSQADSQRETELKAANAELALKIAVLDADVANFRSSQASGAAELASKDQQLNQLTQAHSELEKTLAAVQKREADLKQANETFVQKVDDVETAFAQKCTDSEQLRKEFEDVKVSMMKVQQEATVKFSSEKVKLEEEVMSLKRQNTTLQSQVAILEGQLADLKSRNPKPDKSEKLTSSESEEELNKVQSQLDSANKMIDFLHSVIADQQKRLEMANAVGSPLSESSPAETNLPVRPPRLYCDICECFDLHSTEDCPQQGGESAEAIDQQQELHRRGSPPSSESTVSNTSSGIGNVNNKRKAPPPPRPYCTTCEVFGHTAETCVSDLTF